MSDPARDLRYARWLLERALRDEQALPDFGQQVSAILGLLRLVTGDYQLHEPELFAQAQTQSDNVLDLWAEMTTAGELKASDR